MGVHRGIYRCVGFIVVGVMVPELGAWTDLNSCPGQASERRISFLPTAHQGSWIWALVT